MSLAPDEAIRLVSDRRVADKLIKDPRVVRVSLLAASIWLPARIVSWFLWSWPTRWLMRRFFLNPWSTLVFVLKTHPPRDAKNDLQVVEAPGNTPAASPPTP